MALDTTVENPEAMPKFTHHELDEHNTASNSIVFKKKFEDNLFKLFNKLPKFKIATKTCCSCQGDCSSNLSCECNNASSKAEGMQFQNACTTKCRCSPIRCKNRVLAPIKDLTFTQKVRGKGKGLFAKRDIPDGTCIGFYKGELKVNDYDDTNISYDMTIFHVIKTKDIPEFRSGDLSYNCLVVNATPVKGGNIRYINHQCYGANITPRQYFMRTTEHTKSHFPFFIAMFANRDITAGEEITFNYKGEEGRRPVFKRFGRTVSCKCKCCLNPPKRPRKSNRVAKKKKPKQTKDFLMSQIRSIFRLRSHVALKELRRLLIDTNVARIRPGTKRRRTPTNFYS